MQLLFKDIVKGGNEGRDNWNEEYLKISIHISFCETF